MADSKDGSLEHIVRPESKEVFKKNDGGLSQGYRVILKVFPVAKSGVI